jgi:hypothetical protein
MRLKTLALPVIAVLAAAACGPASTTPTLRPASTGSIEISTRTATPVASLPASASPSTSDSDAPDDTVWLCRPGLANNPCAGDLSATLVAANGKTTVEKASPTTDPPIDCFYVYPTVSRQKDVNATLAIDPEEVAVARAQAAMFSKVCDVYAPMYPQLTLAALANPSSITLEAAMTAYDGVRSAFLDYMAHYNGGRGVVFIGHSQGTFMLTMLLRGDVDPVPEVRARVVSALLIGGNVAGGDLPNMPPCSSATQTGCVVAYSSFSATPPADAYFGRTSSPINPFKRSASASVLCVNPAAPAGGKGTLRPYIPTSGVGALLNGVDLDLWPAARTTGKTDMRPGLPALTRPQWGLHVLDVNLALGNLVELVGSQSAAHLAAS